MRIEVSFSPTEFAALRQRDLSNTTCVVFDILRATTTMVTALANGAKEILPVTEISEAVALRERNTDFLLAGEREGLRIVAAQTGSVDFDFGNSPREFVSGKVQGKSIVMTTTNGTRALRSCDGAQSVLIGSFLNLSSVRDRLVKESPANLLLVCAGTFEETAYEDVLAAGALIEALCEKSSPDLCDSAHIARQTFQKADNNLLEAMRFSKNARRLLSQPDLRDDVAFCVQRDTTQLVAGSIENRQAPVKRITILK